MSGHARAFKQLLGETCPAAYVHCAAHKAFEIQVIRNAFGTMSEVITFFRIFTKRILILEKKDQVVESSVEFADDRRHIIKHLKRLCDTRCKG
jgi:hypothetical protein